MPPAASNPNADKTTIGGAPATAKCANAECKLEAEFGHDLCILHTRRVSKGVGNEVEKAALHDAFRKLASLGVIRIRDLFLVGADLSGLMLSVKNLQHSDLTGVNFYNARFDRVGFDFSTLDKANFESAIFDKVDLRRATVVNARWAEAILDGVKIGSLRRVGLSNPYESGQHKDLAKAGQVFSMFKELYTTNGQFDTAGAFWVRECDLKRVTGSWVDRVWWWTLWATCGYGEEPKRTAGLFFIIIFGFALIYTMCTLNVPDGDTNNLSTCLYFSVVTFTSLGYGEITPVGIARFFAAAEALLGVFSISLFVFVFCRRMTR